jgi:hypothetical protein
LERYRRGDSFPWKLKPDKNSKLPKFPEIHFEPFGKGGWPLISTWITILDRRMRTSKRGNVEYLRVGIKGTNPSKGKWIGVGKVRELYPHLQID